MNRLSIVVAACLLGTGCVTHDTCDSHDVWISWSSFVRATDTGYETSTACFTDFAEMRAYVNGELVGTARCLDDAVPVTLLTGSYDVRVDGVDGTGIPLVRGERTVSISDSCGEQVVDTQPGESVVNLRYTLPGNVCDAEVGPSFMWFRVSDPLTGKLVAEQDEQLPVSSWQTFTCSAANGSAIILPAGSFDLEFIEEWVALRSPVGGIGDVAISSASCNPQRIDAVAGKDEDVGVTLTPTTAACQ